MFLLIGVTGMLGLVLLFCSCLAYDFGLYGWGDWTGWLGWGGLAFSTLISTGLGSIKILKALVPVIRNKFPLGKQFGASTDRAKLNGDRRVFLNYSLNAGLAVVSGSVTFRALSEAVVPRVKLVPMAIKNLPSDLEGFSIVQITDLHVASGMQIHRHWVQYVVDQVNRIVPDVIALTGDIADGIFDEIQFDLAPLADLKSKFGTFYVTGNHEYWHGVNRIIRGMKEFGFIVLMNEHRVIQRGRASLMIGGVADYSAPSQGSHASSPTQAISGAKDSDFKILLAHQPRSVYEAARAGFDLQLSGHTHGGLFMVGAWLRSLAQPFQSGLYRYQNTRIYVSNGTGYWGPPLRYGAPSEITWIQLTRARTSGAEKHAKHAP